MYMYSNTDSSPMCAIYTVGGGNTPKELTAIEPKEEEEETGLLVWSGNVTS